MEQDQKVKVQEQVGDSVIVADKVAEVGAWVRDKAVAKVVVWDADKAEDRIDKP